MVSNHLTMLCKLKLRRSLSQSIPLFYEGGVFLPDPVKRVYPDPQDAVIEIDSLN